MRSSACLRSNSPSEPIVSLSTYLVRIRVRVRVRVRVRARVRV